MRGRKWTLRRENRKDKPYMRNDPAGDFTEIELLFIELLRFNRFWVFDQDKYDRLSIDVLGTFGEHCLHAVREKLKAPGGSGHGL